MKREDNEHRNLAIDLLNEHFNTAGGDALDTTEIVDAIMDAVKQELMPFKDKYERKRKELEAKPQDELTEHEIDWLACARFGQNPFNG